MTRPRHLLALTLLALAILGIVYGRTAALARAYGPAARPQTPAGSSASTATAAPTSARRAAGMRSRDLTLC